MPSISVVLPMYNAAKTIIPCLDSIAAQTFSDFEVVLVNDGSTDDSPALCAAYCEKDPRFRLITQENGGPSVARNRSIEEAVGKYIMFVDSDDYVEPDMMATMFAAAEDARADITVCGYLLDKGDTATPSAYRYPTGTYREEDCRRLAIDSIDIHSKTVLPPYSPVRLIRNDFIKGLPYRYDSTIVRSEDYLLWVQLHFAANCVCMLTDTHFYHYVVTGGSITHRYVKGYWDMALKIYHTLQNDLPQTDEIAARLDNMLIHRTLISLNNAAAAHDKDIFRADCNAILRNKEVRRIVRSWGLKEGMRKHGAYYLLLKLRLYSVIQWRYKLKH